MLYGDWQESGGVHDTAAASNVGADADKACERKDGCSRGDLEYCCCITNAHRPISRENLQLERYGMYYLSSLWIHSPVGTVNIVLISSCQSPRIRFDWLWEEVS